MNKDLEKCLMAAELFKNVDLGFYSISRCCKFDNPKNISGCQVLVSHDLFTRAFAPCEIEEKPVGKDIFKYAAKNGVLFLAIEEGTHE